MGIDIRNKTIEELQEEFVAFGEKSFRAKQVYSWLWEKAAQSFDEMTNLSLSLRERLKDQYVLETLSQDLKQESSDGTTKLRFRTTENFAIEGVMIPEKDRTTACVSSQVGCSLSCAFCATGQMKRMKNLTAGEIYDQFHFLNAVSEEKHGRGLGNLVYMGMGEPLLNFSEVKRSIELISGPSGRNFSQKRITLSTAGIAKAIVRLADEGLKVRLALSLHAANDEKRNQIMEINQTNNLSVLKSALKHHSSTIGRRISLEYIALGGFNDSLTDAKDLISFAHDLPCHINIIEYNSVDGLDFKKSSRNTLQNFVGALEKGGLRVSVRRSRGEDIDAACGQLANKD